MGDCCLPFETCTFSDRNEDILVVSQFEIDLEKHSAAVALSCLLSDRVTRRGARGIHRQTGVVVVGVFRAAAFKWVDDLRCVFIAGLNRCDLRDELCETYFRKIVISDKA